MSPVSCPNTDAAVDEAVALFLHLKSGAATTADAERLIAWRACDVAHDAALIEVARLWRGLRLAAAEESLS